MFTSLLAVPLALSFFSPFPFPSFKPFPFPTSTATPAPSAVPSQAPSPTPEPSVTSAVEIIDVEPSSANFMQEFTLTGFNFGSNPGSINFRQYNQSFSSGGAPIVSWNSQEIKAKVPAVKKGSYRIQVTTSENKKSNEDKFTVKNGQPIINSTSLRAVNGEYEFVFQGTEFGSRRGEINIYLGNAIAGKGIIKYWSSSRVRFEFPPLPHSEYGFQIQTSDGRQSSLKFFTVGN
ncbi:IPT/TIG domain-containing protein [Candidatus Daviesbacteria bacterium]|nr:IPT/TIG domain-containing protein [Candidatus Daviesbacteria bacterium]